MDGDLPPPAYSEQEFDRKIASVAEISLNTPQPAYTDEEGWEEFDEAAYERAAAALASLNVSGQGSGSNEMISGASSQWLQFPSDDKPSKVSSTSIEPLRIDKKSKLGPTEVVTKPLPSWLADAERMPPSQTAGSSSSFVDGRNYAAPPQPHNDGSKLGPTETVTKPRPSWLEDAERVPPSQTAGSSSSFMDGRDYAAPPQPHNYGEERSSPSPPPSFEAEAPSWGNHAAESAVPLSYDGGSSTQASPPSWGNHAAENAVPPLSYDGGSSTQASPLVSPQTSEAVLPQSTPLSPLSPLDMQFQTYTPPHHHPHIQNTYNQLHGRPVRQSLPVPPMQQTLPVPPMQQTLHVVPEPRPTSIAPPSMRFAPPPPPQMDFHSSVAYGKRTLGNDMPAVQTQQQQQQQQQYRQPGPPLTFDPKDFYNSAVSAHLSTHERATQARRPYSSIPSQYGLQNMQPMQSYNQQANNNQWPQANNALGAYSPTPVPQRQTVVQPHPTYPNQPPFMPSYGTNNNQWGSSNPQYSGYYQ